MTTLRTSYTPDSWTRSPALRWVLPALAGWAAVVVLGSLAGV